jgi:signal transduction histidine kinase
MGALIRAFDWSGTALGPAHRWPQSLRTAAGILLESHFGMYIAWGPEYIQLYNDRYRPILGSTKHPAIGQRARDTFAESWHIIGPLFDQVMGGQGVGSDDWMLPLDRHGYLEECFFTFSYSPVRDESGSVGGILVTVTETTGRVLGARRLVTLRDLAARAATTGTEQQAWSGAAEAMRGSTADLPFVGLYAIDEDGRTARLAGRTGDAAAPVMPAFIDSDDPGSVWPIRDVLATGRTTIVRDVRDRVGDVAGPVWPEAVHTAVLVPVSRPSLDHPYGVLVAAISPRLAYDDAFRDFLALAADHVATAVSNARALEDERRRAAALAELDRAKTAFFSNVSHEFRTPLTLMLSPTEDALASPEQALTGDDLATVHRNELRLLKLVNTLLDFSRIEAGRAQASYEPVDLAELTTDLASAFRSAIGRAGLAFAVDCPPLSGPVCVDREMWEKIVLNLLSNALKFTFEGSIGIALRERDGCAVLEVRDTGVGIPITDQRHLFERFHRVQGTRARTHEGSGIGLALVNELVKMHAGTLAVSSAPGDGTTFTIAVPMGTAHLPAERLAPARTAAPAAGATPYVEEALRWLPGTGSTASTAPALPDGAAGARPARIVLADDNADMRDYIRRILGDRWTVETFGNGLDALEAVRADPPALVIADIMMPGLDGFELLRELRSRPPTADVPVMMLSARAGEEARIDGLQAGADDYLAKPFSARELRARVEAQILRAEIRHVEEAHDRRLLNVFRHAPVAIAILRGPDHVFEFANEPYLALIGHRPLLGKPLHEALPELRTQGVSDLLDGVYAAGEPYIAESRRVFLNRGPGGAAEEAFFKFVYQPLLEDDGRIDGIAVVAIEVTELANARRAAESANLAKDEFIAMLSHELRNPLSPILTALQIMRLRGGDAAERERTVIERQVRHLVGLVDDLLDVSRITRGKIELKLSRLELGAVVASAVEMASPILEARRHALEVHVAPSGLSVDGDAARLAQVVSNLLTNAAKYTEPGGQIVVAAGRDGDAVALSVRDSGVGIDADMLPRVFDLFTQAPQNLDRSQGGLGIGLAIVRSLVMLHGGTVTAASAGPGRGSTFTIRLPFAPIDQPARREEARAPAAAAAAPDGARVLIVDDNQDSADMIAELITSLGHETRIAHDGPAALAVVQTFRPDVALLDIGLPVMDGYELGRRLKSDAGLPGIRLVAVTGYGQPRDREASAGAGFDAHLVKPVNLDELTGLLAQLTKPSGQVPS